MKTLLSIALFAAILHADAAPEIPDSSQQAPNSTQEMPAQTTPDSSPDSSQEQPAQEMPDTSTEMDDAAPTMTAPVTTEPMQQEEIIWICEPLYGNFILAEFKMGYFRFGDRTLRHTYSDGLLDMQLASSFRVWKPLYIYAAIEYIGADGRTLGGHKKTQIRLVPLSLGLQYIQKITFDLKYYLTVGPRLFHFHQKNHSRRLASTVNKWGCGGFINTGFMYYLSENLLIDFFGEYSYKRMHFKTNQTNFEGRSLQIGGLTLGAGLGYFW